jgi:phosphatidylserine/phosphatidylglycerophosphate/cardiolipin synthase-like enzyme
MMIKKRWPLFLLLLMAMMGGNTAGSTPAPLPAAGTILVFFSPNGGATDAILSEIGAAHKEIFVQAYSFSSQPIARALVAARKRGVTVEVVFDKSQWSEKYSAADFTHNAGIPTYIDDTHAIAHNKIMIIDRKVILTGSFNFTKAAEERNAENLLVIKENAPLMEKYLANFEAHKSHSTLYNGR